MRHGRIDVTGKTIGSTLWTTLLVAAAILTSAHGQDAIRSGTPSANHSSPSAVPSPAPDKATMTGNDPAGAQQTRVAAGAAPAATETVKPPPVCFKLTGRCVDPTAPA